MTKRGQATIEDILARMRESGKSEAECALVQSAYAYALEMHEGQRRVSGEPYITHCLEVAYLLADLGLPQINGGVIAAALLHDVLEDCEDKGATLETLTERFGAQVATWVNGVTKLKEIDRQSGLIVDHKVPVRDDHPLGGHRRDLQEQESLRKLLIAMADDPRVIYIKLADRLHNMRTLSNMKPEQQHRTAQETLDIFAPLANRIGIWVWKAELEDLAFRYLEPEKFYSIVEQLDARREEREARVLRYKQKLEALLRQEGFQRFEVQARAKHIYSIYRKMERKQVTLDKIHDREALRVLIDSDNENDCYIVLGLVHHIWRPVPGEFDDYIVNKKPNGYQSLHTAVFGDDGETIEIQIRTYNMHEVAEKGVAAHWKYKEDGITLDDSMVTWINWMRESAAELKDESSAVFVDSIRQELLSDSVIVFTPDGKVIELPNGATPIDFAYRIHTELGHTCRGAIVSNREHREGVMVPLNYKLQTGDIVRIIRGRQGPSRDWLVEELGYVKTPRARQKIKQWFRKLDREENIAMGRAALERSLKQLRLEFPVATILTLLSERGERYQSEEDFFEALGVGELSLGHVVHLIEQYLKKQEEERERQALEQTVIEAPHPSKPVAIDIMQSGDLLSRRARCCNPLPGQPIRGYITRGRGVSIHAADCKTLQRLEQEEPERIVEVTWGKVDRLPVQLVILVRDRSNMLYDITGVFVNEKISINGISTGKRDRYNIVPIYVGFEIGDLAQLTRLMEKLEAVRDVIKVERVG